MDTEQTEPMDEDSKTTTTSTSPKASAESSATPSSGPVTTSSGKHPAPSPAAAPTSQQSKRKRGPGIVTPNACTECRKKRAKCDGQTPCSRCKAQKDVECVYEIPVRQSKEYLRAEIDHLRRQQRNNESVLSALGVPGQWEEVLRRLRNGQSIESISEWLGGTLPSGGGTAPSFNRPAGPAGSGFTPVPTFSGAHSGLHATAPAGSHPDGATSPASAHPASGLRQDREPASPWGGHFSAQSAPSESPADAMSWSGERRGQSSRVGTWVDGLGDREAKEMGDPEARDRVLHQGLPPKIPDSRIPVETWTSLTADIALVQHLLALYFCWEYPTFASLSKEHFVKDFQEGRPRYCSSVLVNALMALGCRFSSKPQTRANPDDPHTSGDHFFKECQRLLYEEQNHHSLTTIQALGIMSIREASCGRDSESWFYAGQSIKLAIEMGLHKIQEGGDRDDAEIAVQSATFWGAFALDHAWSLATGSLPQVSCFLQLPPKPGIIDDIEASLWIPYTEDGTSLQKSFEQPSNVRSVYKCFCELSELVHQSLYILHSPGRPLTARDLLGIYTEFLNWYANIPEVLRLGANFTPSVLFAHMYYHFAILLLFRPLIKLRIIGSSVTPRDVCAQAADAISGLLRSYSQLYTLRRTPSFVPYFVLTSAIMHLAIGATATTDKGSQESPSTGDSSRDTSLNGSDSAVGGPPPSRPGVDVARMNPKVTAAIKQGIADLTEMAPCHHFAEQALNILRHLAKKWNIDDIEVYGKDERAAPTPEAENSVLPVTSSLNFFTPNMSEQDFICDWDNDNGAAGSVSYTTTAHGVDNGLNVAAAASAGRMANPLFWPFPMQGRPMLPSGKLLREAGFEVL
ncbi:hypothetical protein ACKVV1_011197 [Pyricularia oryzae]